MIRHIVLYTYHSKYSEKDVTQVFNELDAISSRLPGRLCYSFGKYDSNEGRNRDYTHALVVDFENEKARDAFLEDPVRLSFSKEKVVPKMIGGIEGLVSFDYKL